jgi:hypothetical protein
MKIRARPTPAASTKVLGLLTALSMTAFVVLAVARKFPPALIVIAVVTVSALLVNRRAMVRKMNVHSRASGPLFGGRPVSSVAGALTDFQMTLALWAIYGWRVLGPIDAARLFAFAFGGMLLVLVCALLVVSAFGVVQAARTMK